MKGITGLLAGLSLGLLAVAPAMAQDDEELAPFFIGVDYTAGNVTFFDTQDRTFGCGTDESSCDRVKFRPNGARINLGLNLHPKFVLQAAYGRGNGEERGTNSTASSDTDSRVALKSYYGIYARASTPLEGFGGLRLGGIIGYSSARVEVASTTVDTTDNSVTETFRAETVGSPSFGVEVALPIFGSSLFVLDWMSLVDEDRVRISTANAGFRFGFGGGGEDDDF